MPPSAVAAFSRRAAGRRLLGAMLGLGALCGAALPLAAEDRPLSPVGDWLVEDISGSGVLDREQTTLTLAGDGTFSGSSGCNAYHGKATLSGARLVFGPPAATRMTCTPAVMAQERKFFSALETVQAWRADPLRHQLFLLALTGSVVVRLSAR